MLKQRNYVVTMEIFSLIGLLTMCLYLYYPGFALTDSRVFPTQGRRVLHFDTQGIRGYEGKTVNGGSNDKLEPFIEEYTPLKRTSEVKKDFPSMAFVTIKLPLKYSQKERHQNIGRLKNILPDLIVYDGIHGNDMEALQNLVALGRLLNLRISPRYFDGSGNPVHLGKIGLYATFLSIFHEFMAFNDGKKVPILSQEGNPFKAVSKFDCLVVIEDDYILSPSDVDTIRKECKDFMKNNPSDKVFRRMEFANFVNVYRIDKLHKIIEKLKKTGITNPFDIYTQAQGFSEKPVYRIRGSKLDVKSTLVSQPKVTIDSWNRCMQSAKSCNLELLKK